MKRNKVSRLAGQLMVGILLFSILLCAVSSYLGYREFTEVLERQYNDSAYEVAMTASSCLDPDKLDTYLETGKKCGVQKNRKNAG